MRILDWGFSTAIAPEEPPPKLWVYRTCPARMKDFPPGPVKSKISAYVDGSMNVDQLCPASTGPTSAKA